MFQEGSFVSIKTENNISFTRGVIICIKLKNNNLEV